MEYVLSMTFVTSGGDKASFSVTGVKESITEAEVSALMDTIIAKDIFITKSGSYVSKYGAQLTQRQITKYDL